MASKHTAGQKVAGRPARGETIDLRQYEDCPDDQLVDEFVCAAWVNQKPSTLRRHRWLGIGIAWIKLGSSVRYRVGDIRATIRANRHEPLQ